MRSGAVWVLRVLWFLLPLTLGQAAGDAAASADNAVPQTLTIGLWVLWAAGLIATVVLLPVTLTIVRIVAPGAAALGLWALFDTDFSTTAIIATAHGVLVAIVALHQLIGDRFVDGASYGDERRMLLRPPAPLAYGVVPLLWLLITASLATGPLLVADERWILGVASTLLGLVIIVVVSRALDQLTRRWIVFVPTGMVLHDLSAITEPVLLRRTAIERLGPAISGSPARDLTGGAAGLLLECELTDPAPLGLRTMSGAAASAAELTDVRRFLFAPTRPGELLDEAERRNIAVAG